MAKHFDINEFKYALATIKTNPWLSVNNFHKYFERYPDDYTAYPYYINSLIAIGNFNEAEIITNKLLEIVSKDKRYINIGKFDEHFRKEMFFVRIKLYAYQGKWHELYNLYMSNQDILFPNSEYIFTITKKKLGILTNKDLPNNSYVFNQINEYSEEKFREHIKRHTFEYNETLENRNDFIFEKEFLIDRVIEEIKKHLLNEPRLFQGYYEDIYIFQLNNCGKVFNKITNYFKVVCFHDTKNIITMTP